MSPQTSFSANMPAAYPGLLAAVGPHYTNSGLALAAVPFGVAVARGSVDGQVRVPAATRTVITFSGALVTSNSVAMTVNGVALTATVFATDDATTLGLIAAKIAAKAGVTSATVGTNSITVLGTDAAVLITGTLVTLGAGQVTAAVVYTTADDIMGISRHEHRQPLTIGGTSVYEAGSEVAILEKGVIWVMTEGAVAAGAQAFVRFAAGSATALGGIRGDADSATCVALPGSRFASKTTGAALAKLEINLPQ